MTGYSFGSAQQSSLGTLHVVDTGIILLVAAGVGDVVLFSFVRTLLSWIEEEAKTFKKSSRCSLQLLYLKVSLFMLDVVAVIRY